MEVTPSQFDVIKQMMSASQLRHQVVSHNLANVNTPGYHRKDVDFEEQLGAILRAGNESVDQLTPNVFEVEGLPERADGNNVDVDREIGELNKNSLLYQTWSQILASRISMMRSAINGN